MPAFASAWIISSRPDFANSPGKNPRFPTMTPIVIFLPDILLLDIVLSPNAFLLVMTFTLTLLVGAMEHSTRYRRRQSE